MRLDRPCIECGKAETPTSLHPGGAYHEEPQYGGGYRPVYDGPICADCFGVADRREATTSLTPAAEAGSVGTPSEDRP